MSKAMTYLNAALGSTGFCVLHWRVAYRLMPDSWSDGMAASDDFKHKSLPAKLSTVPGVQVYLARFAEIPGALVKVMTRSPDMLAERILWVTGFKPILLVHESELQGKRDESTIPPRKTFPTESTEGGDLHAGLVSAEPGRTCNQCEWATNGSGCRNSEESLIRFPSLTAPRRCIAYRPRFETLDPRLGISLWPELKNTTI